MTRTCTVCGGPIPPEKPASTKTCSPKCQKESRRAYLRDYMREDRQRNPEVHKAREMKRAPERNARRRKKDLPKGIGPEGARKIAIIRKRLSRGDTLTEIAEDFGVDLSLVSRLAKKAGITTPHVGRGSRRYDWARIFSDAAGNKTAREIAEAEGIDPTIVRKRAKELGVGLKSGKLYRQIDWEDELQRAVNDNETRADLARRLKVSSSTVYGHAVRHGITLRDARGRPRRKAVLDTPALRSSLLRAARAAANMTSAQASSLASLSKKTLLQAEHGHAVSDRTFYSLKFVYDGAGVEIDLHQGFIRLKT